MFVSEELFPMFRPFRNVLCYYSVKVLFIFPDTVPFSDVSVQRKYSVCVLPFHFANDMLDNTQVLGFDEVCICKFFLL